MNCLSFRWRRSTRNEPIVVDWEGMPTGDCVFFHGQQSDYPSPDEVRSGHKDALQAHRPVPTLYVDRRLVVKWGKQVSITEGQCLWYLRKHLSDRVPVPEIYGWIRDGDQIFLYMELVDGDRLDERVNECTWWQRRKLALQLHDIVRSLRCLQPPKMQPPLASISGGPLREIYFQDAGISEAGPFDTVAQFHDAFAGLIVRQDEDYNPRKDDSDAMGLDDSVPVVFTHADLDFSNILVSKRHQGPLRIVSIIDWHQSGWYPEPWEYMKTQMLWLYNKPWMRQLPRIFTVPKYEYYYSWEYLSMRLI